MTNERHILVLLQNENDYYRAYEDVKKKLKIDSFAFSANIGKHGGFITNSSEAMAKWYSKCKTCAFWNDGSCVDQAEKHRQLLIRTKDGRYRLRGSVENGDLYCNECHHSGCLNTNCAESCF